LIEGAMDIDSDWMQDLLETYRGARLIQSEWSFEEWDHDHCTVCGKTIDVGYGLAYCTEDEEDWFCRECFEKWRDAFGWVLVDKSQGEESEDDRQ